MPHFFWWRCRLCCFGLWIAGGALMLTLERAELQQGSFRLTADVSFDAGVTAVIGPSGSGKSSLLAAVAGFRPLRAGRVLWEGQPLDGQEPGARPVSVLFQDHNLFPHLTLAQNVGLALRPDLRLRGADVTLVGDSLRDVGLNGLGQRKPAAVSGGQQSRAALARVLLADRPVVLLDEPFAALGPGLKAEMLTLVRAQLAGPGRVIVMVTHDPDDARAIADQTCLVADGQAQAPVATDALFANPPPALRAYLGDA